MIDNKMKQQLVSIIGYGLILFGCLSLIFEVWNALTLRMHFRAQGAHAEEFVTAKTIYYILYISSAFPVFLCTIGLYILKDRWKNWVQLIIAAGLIFSSIWLLIVSFQTC